MLQSHMAVMHLVNKQSIWFQHLPACCSYCECFANGEFCNDCNCCNCFNNLQHEEERSRAVKACLDRNPHAFHPKIGETCVVLACMYDIEISDLISS